MAFACNEIHEMRMNSIAVQEITVLKMKSQSLSAYIYIDIPKRFFFVFFCGKMVETEQRASIE